MDLCTDALKNINISEPYFIILSEKTHSIKLRKLLLTEAPKEFFCTVTQLSRHFLNGSLCKFSSKSYLKQFKNALYILSDPETTLEEKKIIIGEENPELIRCLYHLCIDKIKNE